MRSLQALDRRHLIIIGDRGSGKSTLFSALTKDMPCIRTHAVPGQAVYWQDIRIGAFDPAIPGTERKMRPVEEGFRQAAQRLSQVDTPWLAVDEIGYLEPDWFLALLQAKMESSRLLAVVRKQESLPISCADALVADLDGSDLGCVIMASGLGQRFGGNKLMAPLGGKTVIEWAMDAAEAVFSRCVVVTRHEDVAQLCQKRQMPVVLHKEPYRSDTVRLGLQALGEISGCLFLPGDQPFVTKDSLYAMALCAQNSPEHIWQLGGASPVLFPKWAFAELLSLPQGKGGGVVVKQHPDKVRSIMPESDWEIRDIDTPQDLACFCAGICCN